MAYALTFIVVLGRACAVLSGLSWLGSPDAGRCWWDALACCQPSLAPIVLLVWAFLEAWRLCVNVRRVWHRGTGERSSGRARGWHSPCSCLASPERDVDECDWLTGAEASGLWLAMAR